MFIYICIYIYIYIYIYRYVLYGMQYAIIIAHFQCKSSISKHLRYEIFHAQCDPLETLYIHVDIIVFLYFCALYFHTYFYRNRPFVLELSNIRPKSISPPAFRVFWERTTCTHISAGEHNTNGLSRRWASSVPLFSISN